MSPGLFDAFDEPPATVANPFLLQEPDLIERMTALRAVVTDRLLDLLIEKDRLGRAPEPLLDALEEAHAVAIVLRVLTKPAWNANDLDQFDAYWQTAWRSELFGDEFEEARFRIGHAAQEARHVLLEGHGYRLGW